MIKIAGVAATFVALALPASLSAATATENVRQAYCVTHEIINPDGSGESTTHCVTNSNGQK